MNTKILDVVKTFPTTPFLFVGAGLTRRYYSLPNWEGLLELFARKINDNSLTYPSYKDKAASRNKLPCLLPKIAELIEKDFNEKWFKTPEMRTLDLDYISKVETGASPFKAEIAAYIKDNSNINPIYKQEIDILQTITKSNIAGIITTNYDNFLENIADGYSTYIGQEELIFSPIQGIAEIYKIHGSIEKPNSIVINENDYLKFDKTCSYLAAKLMTIFLEYPIIFIGYSLTDDNILKIITSIVDCLSSENSRKLENRFIFIEYEKNFNGVDVSPYTMNIDRKLISMTKIKIEDFTLLYEALKIKQTALPVKLLRMFKNEFYKFTMTNQPTANLRVAGIDDKRIENEDLVLAICKPAELGLRGLSGIEADDWYKDILLDNLDFSADDILTVSYPQLIKRVNKLPIHKYLALAENKYPDILAKEWVDTFDGLVSKTFIGDRFKRNISDRSICGIVKNYESKKAMELIAHLLQEEINLNDLEYFLFSYLNENPSVFTETDSYLKTNLRRLIRIYDWMKYAVKI